MQFITILVSTILLGATAAFAQSGFGAAPKGDPRVVASRIIKDYFPTSCKSVTKAVRLKDGSIQAICSGTEYRVGTVFSAKDGQLSEFALNCRKVKELLNVDC